MAMKTRTSSSVRPVYDDFEPSTVFSESHEARFLRILLPGFTKDQMKITFMHFTRMLNISGERQMDSENDRWVRFNQSYPIPKNCEEGKLQANIDQGVLTITMPKNILSQQSPPTESQQKGPFPSKKQEPRPDEKAQEDIPQKAQEKPTAPRLEESKPDKIPQKYAPTWDEELKPKTKATLKEPRPEEAQEKLEGPKPEKAHEHIPQGSTPRTLKEQKPEGAHEEEIPFKFRIRRGNGDLIQKIEEDERGLKGKYEEMEPTPTTIKSQRKPIDETEQRPTLKFAPKNPKDEKPEKERETEKGGEGKLLEKSEKMLQEKEIRARKRTPETAEKEKETLNRGKEDIVSTIGKGIRQLSASTSEVVAKISEAKWKEEEKPMLVNMGAAILVIAALGVYVSYKISST